MWRSCGLPVVVYDATFARVTTVESPTHMVTLPTPAVQTSISAYCHSRKSTKRQLRFVFRSPSREWICKTNFLKPGAGQDQHYTKSDGPIIKPSQPVSRVTRSIMTLAANFLPWNFVKFATPAIYPSLNELK